MEFSLKTQIQYKLGLKQDMNKYREGSDLEILKLKSNTN